MTNAELIAKIKAEIERLESIEYPCDNSQQETGFFNALDRMTDFLSTLESEKPIEGLKEEYKDYVESDPVYSKLVNRNAGLGIARHFAKWGAEHAKIDVTDFCKPIEPSIAKCIADNWWEMLGEDEKPVPTELEEAAKNYALNTAEDSEQYSARYLGYKDGAKWQKEQDDKELSEKIAAAYQLGVKDKEQMMKEAVEGEVVLNPYPTICLDDCKNYDFKDGDKVKVIIVKEDDQ